MKQGLAILLAVALSSTIAFLGGIAAGVYLRPPCPQLPDIPVYPRINTYFSPNGGCTDAIVAEIGKAKSNVLVMAYSFTSDRIAGALADADRRGVDVRLIVDGGREEERGGDLQTVTAAGVQTYIDSSHAIAHNKVMVIDSETVITGSFNFSAAAEERNAENLLVIRDQNLARRYEENWQKHAGHSQPYDGKGISP